MSVKRSGRGRPKASGSKIDRESIITMSKALMKQEGKTPSIRGLASKLDVNPMAIYYYFENKTKLLEAITTSLVSDVYSPNTLNYWKLELRELCISYLKLLEEYPGLLETLLTMDSVSPAEIFFSRFKVIIESLSLDSGTTKDALDLLGDYLHGYALALNCNKGTNTLTVDMIAGPLELFCSALENKSSIKS